MTLLSFAIEADPVITGIVVGACVVIGLVHAATTGRSRSSRSSQEK